MSDEGYSTDEDAHIGGDADPVMDPTLSVDVGSGLSVRLARLSAVVSFAIDPERDGHTGEIFPRSPPTALRPAERSRAC
jgi:hypothetical protein